MVVPNHYKVIQEKLSPGECEYLRYLAIRPRFYRFEGPVYEVETKVENWLQPPQRWSVEAKYIHQRIMESSAFDDKNDCDYVRIALHTGQLPRLTLRNPNIPTSCLIFDLPNRVVRQSWMNGKNIVTGMEDDIPCGMKIVCQQTMRQVYEDWVGIGPSPMVFHSAGDIQCERELHLMLAEIPIRSSFPLLSTPSQASP
jgi:hypothetical protein